MLHNDAAQQQPGEKQASAPEASQKSTRAQGQAKFKILTLTRKGSQPEDINAASLTGGNMETPHIVYIHGRHSPPTCLDLTTHTMEPTQQPLQGSTKILWQQPTPLPWLARYHSFGEGHVPARSVLGLEQGTEQGQLPRYATEDLQQNPEQTHNKRPGNTEATTTAQYTHSTLLKSSNRPMTAARRRQGQQLYA